MTAALGIGASIVGGLLGKKSGEAEAEAIRAGGAAAEKTLAPFVGPGASANIAISDALGQGAPGAQDQQFQNFLSSTGFQSQLQAGSEAITGNQAAAGLLNSGSTLKRLTRFGQDLGQQGFQNFLSNLGGVATRGLGAATATGNALVGTATDAAGAAAGGANALQAGIGSAFGGLQRAIGSRTLVGGGAPLAPVDFGGPSFQITGGRG